MRGIIEQSLVHSKLRNYYGLMSIEGGIDILSIYQVEEEWYLSYVTSYSRRNRVYYYYTTPITETNLLKLLDGELQLGDIYNNNDNVYEYKVSTGVVTFKKRNKVVLEGNPSITSSLLPNRHDITKIRGYITKGKGVKQ